MITASNYFDQGNESAEEEEGESVKRKRNARREKNARRERNAEERRKEGTDEVPVGHRLSEEKGKERRQRSLKRKKE